MHVSSFSRDIYNDDHCIWSESTIRTLDFRIHSLRSPFMFSGYYTVTGSPYNSVFAHDMTSWPVKCSMWHLSVASHYLTTIEPTCLLVSTLYLHSKMHLYDLFILWEKRMNEGRPYLQMWRGVWVPFCKIAIVSFLSIRYRSDGLYCRMAGTPSSPTLFFIRVYFMYFIRV